VFQIDKTAAIADATLQFSWLGWNSRGNRLYIHHLSRSGDRGHVFESRSPVRFPISSIQ